jgi:MarR family transcriptional regulator, organic hydroperoxide resistance regulator
MISAAELPTRVERRKREANLTELLARANHLIGESLYEGLKAHGLSAAEWRVLGALSEHDGLKMAELAELLLFKQPTLTKVIDRMERAELVQRQASAIDRRCMIARLTERGRRVAVPLTLRLRQHEAALQRTLGTTASREIRAALAELVERLADMPREPRASQVNRPAVV